MVKISIIVPVFNVENYVERCLSSIKNQTFSDFQVIVINDGSTDNSGLLSEAFCTEDSRFVYINQENQGLGNTRNIGINLAEGEYITFIDSDDYISPNMINTLYAKAVEDSADVVCGEVMMIFPDGKKKKRLDFHGSSSYLLTETTKEQFFRDYYFSSKYSHNAWDKIYKTELIKSKNIHFGDNNRIFGEDNFFQLQFLLYAKKISFVNEVVYYYLQRENSIMNSYKSNLMPRQLQMAKDYESLAHEELSISIASLLSFESITMEILNIKGSSLSYKDFKKQMNSIRKDAYFNKKIADLIDLKSYKLIPNKIKKNYIRFISLLEKKGLVNMSSALIYFVYSIK